MKVTVIGGGIVGLWVAALAARAGCSVELFEQYQIGHSRGSSHGDTRIFRSAYWEGGEYVSLAHGSRTLWDWLNEQSSKRIFEMTGGYYLGRHNSPLVNGVGYSAKSYGLPLSEIDPTQLVNSISTDLNAYEETYAGVVYADNALAVLKQYCIMNGVKLHENTCFSKYDETDGIRIYCKGPWFSQDLTYGHLMSSVRVYCHWFSFPAQVQLFQKVFLLQGRDGRILYGMPTPEGHVKVGWHNYPIIPLEPGVAEDSSPDQYIRDIKNALAVTTGAELDHIKSKGCYFTNTPDENYIVEQSSANSWIIGGLSGHGFKFAPALASGVVSSITTGEFSTELKMFSPKRFNASDVQARTHVSSSEVLCGEAWCI